MVQDSVGSVGSRGGSGPAEHEHGRRLAAAVYSPTAVLAPELLTALDHYAWATYYEAGNVLREGVPELTDKGTLSPDWELEVVKKIVALANTTGGCIVFGGPEGDDQQGLEAAHVKALDPTAIGQKCEHFVGSTAPAIQGHESARPDRPNPRFVLVVHRAQRQPLVFAHTPNKDSRGRLRFRRGEVAVIRDCALCEATSADVWAMQDRFLESPLAAYPPERLTDETEKLAAGGRGHDVERYLVELRQWVDSMIRLHAESPVSDLGALVEPALQKAVYVCAGVARRRDGALWGSCCRFFTDVYCHGRGHGAPFEPAVLALRHAYVAGALAVALDALELATSLALSQVTEAGVDAPLFWHPLRPRSYSDRDAKAEWEAAMAAPGADPCVASLVPRTGEEGAWLTYLCQFNLLCVAAWWTDDSHARVPIPWCFRYYGSKCMPLVRRIIATPSRFPVPDGRGQEQLARALVRGPRRFGVDESDWTVHYGPDIVAFLEKMEHLHRTAVQ